MEVKLGTHVYAVESLNKVQVGTSTDVHYLKVVLYWGVSAKISFISYIRSY